MDTLLVSMSNTLDKLAGFVEQQSPAVWEILLKQVYINAIRNVIVVVLALVGLGFCYHWIRVSSKKIRELESRYDRENWWILVICLSFSALALVVVAIVCGLVALGEFMNPGFYAIKFLLP